MIVAALLAVLVPAADNAPSYWRDVRPILVKSCHGCHQPAKAKGGLVLTDVASILRGSDEGEPAIVPGRPDDGALIASISPLADEPPTMPKDGPPLDAADVELLRAWIAAGAPDDSPAQAVDSISPEYPPVYAGRPVLASLDVSPDGTRLAVAGYHEVLLYDTADFSLAARLVGMSERIESVAFAPDGRQLAAVGGSPGRLGECQVWSVRAGRLRLSVPVGFDTLYGASWSNDGSRIAFGCPDSAVRVIDAKSGEIVLFQGAHEDWVLDTTFTSDDSHLVTVSRDRSMKLIKVETQQFIDNVTSITPGVLKGGLMAVDRHPMKDELLIGGADGVARIYRTYRERKRVIGDDYNLLKAFPAVPGRVFDVAYGPSGEVCAIASSTGTGGAVHLYSATLDAPAPPAGEPAPRWSWTSPGGVYALAFDPEGAWLAAGGADGVVRVLSLADGTVLHSFEVRPAPAGARAAPADVQHEEAR